jgi:DNA-binding response OmpR family regulator
MKILIIEDDSETSEFITIALNVAWPDIQIARANCGKKGIELVRNNAPDVVLLDIGLPDTTGFEVLKTIRLFSNVPVIIETVRNSESDIVKGLNLGADEYIAKPFGQLELLARIRTVLKRFLADGAADMS